GWCNKDAFWYNVTLTTNDYTISAIPISGQGDKDYCANGDNTVRVDASTSAIIGVAGTAPSAGVTYAACQALAAQ
ncbi:MAG TPA: hypothetical protein VKT33_13935, partial [Candidatus Angelobacter sp.]|nr:hypothetical protein [Candidatus Angelobacter sp.]